MEPFKILIVEDETGAADYIESIIKEGCPEYTVAGRAEHGEKALELLPDMKPDLVLTDIKMPVMDGIALVQAMSESYPDIPALIISGFQDFEYARSVLNTGVKDYILKPVSPRQLREILSEQLPQLRDNLNRIKLTSLEELIHYGWLPAHKLVFSADQEFRIALYRRGVRQSLFNSNRSAIPGIINGDGVIRFGSRSGDRGEESLYLIDSALMSQKVFESAVRRSLDWGDHKMQTLYFPEDLCLASSLKETFGRIYHDLDCLIIPGKSVQHRGPVSLNFNPGLDSLSREKLSIALESRRPDSLLQVMKSFADRWERDEYTFIMIEINLRKILHLILEGRNAEESISPADVEHLLEDGLSKTSSYREISDCAAELALEFSGLNEQSLLKPDTPASFTDICRWLGERYKSALTLTELSDEFGISPSYLSKLFRKHGDTSFSVYLNTVRINVAKELLRTSPGITMRDVAERTGFNDPYYFSRVFKSISGMSPSEFLKKEGKK